MALVFVAASMGEGEEGDGGGEGVEGFEDYFKEAARRFESAAEEVLQQIRSTFQHGLGEREGEAATGTGTGTDVDGVLPKVDVKRMFSLASEQFLGFIHAVDWTEQWILALIAAEVLLLVLVLATRRHTTPQALLFILLGLVIYLARHINSFCERNWRTFSNQNYFDPQGLFISVMLSGPLLIINAIIVVSIRFRFPLSFFFFGGKSSQKEEEEDGTVGTIQVSLTFFNYFVFLSKSPFFHSLDQVNHLIVLCGLMVKVKRAELKAKARERSKKKN